MRLRHLAALVASLLILALMQAAPVQAAGTKPVAITITKVKCVDDCRNDGLESDAESAADFFAEVWIDGVDLPRTPRAPDDQELVEPFWVKSADVPDTRTQVPISVQIWDWDTTSGHDNGDASPRNNDNNLDITVDMATGRWTGDVNWPQSCSIGDGNQDDDEDEPRVEVCFDISTEAATGDADGDGLLDGWERHGYNDNADSVIDVDLPKMGADPRHKDLFVELDYVGDHHPDRESVAEVRAAYAAAPKDAGGVPNPDGKLGITLHLDMGPLADRDLRESGMPQGTCSDGVDNGGADAIDGGDPDCYYLSGSVEDPPAGDCDDNSDNDTDGKTDANDPDCVIADDFGALARGNELIGDGTTKVCGLNDAFFDIRNTFFDSARRHIFIYGISVDGSPGCTKGGQGRDGNFADHNGTGRTLFHEVGHNLGLQHGGHDENRCKPNYVSLMSYDHNPGIPRQDGGVILDYSPPRTALDGTSRGRAPLDDLVENQLDENKVVDPGDNVNRFIFVDATGNKAPHDLNANPDWSGDGNDPPYEPAPVTANLDTTDMSGDPAKCANTSTTDTLKGSDDWRRIKMPYTHPGGASDLDNDPDPTEAEIQRLWKLFNTAGLSVTLTDTPDPVAAGTDLTYTIKVRNAGPAPATSVRAVVSLPPDVQYKSSSARCTDSGCYLGEIAAHEDRTFTVTAHVAEDLVHRNGGPKTVTAGVEVSNLWGPDPDQSDNKATTSTKVVAVADLAVTGFTATAPGQLLVGQSADVPLKVSVASTGPSSPMHAVVNFTGGVADLAVPALAKGAPRDLSTTARVTCDKPGYKTVGLSAEIAPASADDVDPEPGNNKRTAEFTIDCVIPVALNIKPGSDPNSINPPNANVPLAVLTTRAGEYDLPLAFDATAIQPLTVRFGPRAAAWAGQATGLEVHERGHVEDSLERGNPERVRDGDSDMVLHFGSGESGLVAGTTEACVKGSVTGEGSNVYRFFGCDATRIV
ncbi:DUF11 domain-containing protein [Nonomuraea zeae]|uniref:DUF11 domain-containing protein n=1 Tax=Nonomuraea zeae TaxID=1642303 RepID=A0A5S4FVV2_9ACTN|nr:DUF11 domain-containing protein [Nonomuraea zeae]TMR24742.1 DUF11 domain-containing protein [Nonomuraea zeae]